MWSAVGKSGSPISRWITVFPAASRALARASTSKADSVPSRPIRSARRISVISAMLSIHSPPGHPRTRSGHRVSWPCGPRARYAWETEGVDAGQEQLERAYRDEATRIRAALAARTGDVGLAEDAVQDAFIEAMEHWNRDGGPPNPGRGLATTARRKALDRLRRDKVGADKFALLAATEAWAAPVTGGGADGLPGEQGTGRASAAPADPG